MSDDLRPRDVVRLRAELTRSFSRPEMRQGLEGWLARTRRTDPDPDTVSWMAEVVVDALGRSALYLVAGEMIDLVNHASATVPDYRLHEDDAPAPEGLCCFAKPIRVDDFRYAALSWFRVSHRSRDRGVGLVWWFRPQNHEHYNPRGDTGPRFCLFATTCNTSTSIGSGRTMAQMPVARICLAGMRPSGAWSVRNGSTSPATSPRRHAAACRGRTLRSTRSGS